MRFVILLCLCYAGPSLAGDPTGRFAMKGAGILTCKIFMEAREEQSQIYYMIAGWIDGYLTATNQHMDETYDITSFEKTELLTNVIANHCKDNDDDRLFTVVNSIVTKLNPDRLQVRSPMVTVSVGGRDAGLYVATIARVQLELKNRELYSGPVNGESNPATEKSFKAFQESVGYDATGFPDQASLWRLIRKEE